MQLVMQNENTIYPNEAKSIQQIMDVIGQKLVKDQLFLSHLIVDGEEVYDQHESYMMGKLADLEKIEVVLFTKDAYLQDMIMTVVNYLQQSLPQYDVVAASFYANVDEKSWSKLADFSEGLQYVLQVLQLVMNEWNTEQYISLCDQYEQHIHSLNEACEAKDHTTIADIIQYELKSVSQAFLHELGKLQSEGV